MVIDLTDKLSTYLGRGIPKTRLAYSYVFFLPETISLVLPVAVLFAVVFTVGALGRHSELVAAKASGISFHRVVRPLLAASLPSVVIDMGLPEGLLAEPKARDEMRYAELGRYVDALSRSGSDTRKLRVERALKLSVPFACIIIALFGAPLAISTPRSGTAWGVAVCLATTFVDLLMFQLSKAVGAGGALPPGFAAWVPNRIFGAAGAWLWRHTRTWGAIEDGYVTAQLNRALR